MALRKRLLLALALLLGLIVVSTTGYRVIGGPSVTFLQALYMAVITLAGVGYGEIVDTSHNPALRVFNMFSLWWPPSWWKWNSPTLSGGAECSDI
jgi:voltage-gated potassium channel